MVTGVQVWPASRVNGICDTTVTASATGRPRERIPRPQWGDKTFLRHATQPFWHASHGCERRQAWRRWCGPRRTSARLPPRKAAPSPAGSLPEVASRSRNAALGAGRRGRRGLLLRPGGGRPGGGGQADGRARVAVAAPGPGARAGRARAHAAEHIRAAQGPVRHDHHHLGPARGPPGSAPRRSALFRTPVGAAGGPGTRSRTPGHYQAATPRRPSSPGQSPAPCQAPEASWPRAL
jgi:hypothetical protein